MTASELVATIIAAFLGGGLVAGVAQLMTARTTAKASEVDRLIKLVDALQKDNVRLRDILEQQDAYIAEIRKRLAEVEKCETEHKKMERDLRKYIEYLIDGIQVLIKQALRHNEMPEFDPVSLADFLRGAIG